MFPIKSNQSKCRERLGNNERGWVACKHLYIHAIYIPTYLCNIRLLISIALHACEFRFEIEVKSSQLLRVGSLALTLLAGNIQSVASATDSTETTTVGRQGRACISTVFRTHVALVVHACWSIIITARIVPHWAKHRIVAAHSNCMPPTRAPSIRRTAQYQFVVRAATRIARSARWRLLRSP